MRLKFDAQSLLRKIQNPEITLEPSQRVNFEASIEQVNSLKRMNSVVPLELEKKLSFNNLFSRYSIDVGATSLPLPFDYILSKINLDNGYWSFFNFIRLEDIYQDEFDRFVSNIKETRKDWIEFGPLLKGCFTKDGKPYLEVSTDFLMNGNYLSIAFKNKKNKIKNLDSTQGEINAVLHQAEFYEDINYIGQILSDIINKGLEILNPTGFEKTKDLELTVRL